MTEDEKNNKILELEKAILLLEEKENKSRNIYMKKFSIKISFFYLILILIAIIGSINYISNIEPETIKLFISQDTLNIIKITTDTFIFLIIPFLIGMISSFTRLLLSNQSFFENINIIIASGFLSSFSWITLKSKIFITLLTINISHEKLQEISTNMMSDSDYYTFFLVSIVIGMFAPNFYLALNSKIQLLTKEHYKD